MTAQPPLKSDLLEVIATGTPIPAVGPCNIADCFTNRSVFTYRDPDLDTWFFKEIPSVPSGAATTYQLVKDVPTLSQTARFVLGETTNDPDTLAKLLVERGKTFSPKQVEDLVSRRECSDRTPGLIDNGCANFFFVHDAQNRVCVLGIDRSADGWGVGVYGVEYEFGWGAGTRLLVRT
jgi:hypothetical protein